jgi:hypothetical protein
MRAALHSFPSRCLCSTGVVRDSGETDVVANSAQQHSLQDLPEDTLVFLLGSRYCETDLRGRDYQVSMVWLTLFVRDGHVIDGPAVHPQPCLEARIRKDQIEVRKSNCPLPTEGKAHAEIKTKFQSKRKQRAKQ